MDTGYERKYHQIEEEYWWFQARRDIILRFLEKLDRRTPARREDIGHERRILEVGCSGGPLLAELARRGYRHLTGIDISADAIAEAKACGLTEVSVMDAANLTYPDASFDVVIASDILEHLADDQAALRHWRRVLAPQGILIVFVPAYQWLWSGHDVINHHQRRYTAGSLKRVLQGTDAGLASGGRLEILRLSYWNAGLLAPVGAMRLLQRLRGDPQHQAKDALTPVPALANRLLTSWLSFENWLLAGGLSYPTGVSVMAMARKTAS